MSDPAILAQIMTSAVGLMGAVDRNLNDCGVRSPALRLRDLLRSATRRFSPLLRFGGFVRPHVLLPEIEKRLSIPQVHAS